jgi:hypothetical protein
MYPRRFLNPFVMDDSGDVVGSIVIYDDNISIFIQE